MKKIDSSDFNRISGLNFDEKPFRHNVRVIVNF